MPVSLLLCEGAAASPDLLVLAKLLAGTCEIRPSGGKYGMGDRILARRELLGNDSVFGLLDGDFREWETPRDRPLDWKSTDPTNPVHFGWRWERKEIENYLIDPVVVGKALGTLPEGYCEVLGAAAGRIGAYQAARLALTILRPRFKPLQNAFGSPRGRGRHPFPDALGADECCQQMIDEIATWHEERSVDPTDAKETYFRLLPECLAGGLRHAHFLVGFAGKDLLVEMTADLAGMGFDSPGVFLEHLLTGIGNSMEDLANWLPEWARLHELVTS